MKAKIIKLNKKEQKVIESVKTRILNGEELMRQGAEMRRKANDDLWDALKGMYDGISGDRVCDLSFSYESNEIRYFEVNPEIEKLRQLKEKAIRDKDFEKAARYRDEQKKLKAKELKGE